MATQTSFSVVGEARTFSGDNCFRNFDVQRGVSGLMEKQTDRLRRLARAAKQDGLTLPWAMTHLLEQLERNEQQIARASSQDTRGGDTDAQVLRLENEALALVLWAVLKAYPAGADVEL